MRKSFMLLMMSVILLANAANKTVVSAKNAKLRAPSVPLITSDPYFSIWSSADKLNDSNTSHWTGKSNPLIGVARVDGISYRFMGMEEATYTTILSTGESKSWDATYTEKQPEEGWESMNFNDNSWKKGKGDFSTKDRAHYATLWDTEDIWVRRTFELKEDLSAQPIFIEYSHDDDLDLFVNGVKVIATGNACKMKMMLELNANAKKTLKPGKNIITLHCKNRVGGGYVDFGMLKKNKNEIAFSTKAVQKSVTVLPTQTYYVFNCGAVELNLTFTAPLLLDDLDLISTPINYISYQVRSLDKKSHNVQVYFETTPQLAVNNDLQPVTSEKITKNKLTYLKTGTINQPVLAQSGDDMRIDWGYLYLSAQLSNQEKLVLGEFSDVNKSFIKTGKLPADIDPKTLPTNMKTEMTVLAYSNDLGLVSKNPVKGHLMIGYDDLYSIQYLYNNLLPYWKHEGKVDIFQAFERAEKNYSSLLSRCDAFDQTMMKDAENAGGKEYAELCALAYRQAISAHKLVQDKEGNLLFLSKENNSNGCINTVDLTYPSAPLFLLYNPDLMKGMMNPIFNYSESGRWTKPFPAHDMGQYPLANGQVYGGDMPVEEAGNMLLVTAAVSYREGNADYALKHWDVLTVWADYLTKEGLNPENQLCTDDFAGHSAHNTNLSVKAILGIAGYGKMAAMLGKADVSEKYIKIAREMASKWIAMANDGDHFRLNFDKPGTWSQKYNLIWDKVLDMGIFPNEVAQKEIAFYLTKQNEFGLPLDSRKTYTKSDWIMWTACLADSPEDFRKIVSPVYQYVNETPSRVPLCDWHETTDGTAVGFKARSVIAGYFMKMLEVKVDADRKTKTAGL